MKSGRSVSLRRTRDSLIRQARPRQSFSFQIIPITLKSCLLLVALAGCALLAPERMNGSIAQSSSLRIQLNVINAALPVTIGVPLGEKAGVLDAAQLGVTDAQGAPVASQMRVLARWRGAASDASKPIKWLLVDFKPAAAGTHFLTRAARGTAGAVSANDAGAAIRVANSQLEIEIAKQGETLLGGFKLDGAEMLRAPAVMRMALPRRALLLRGGSTPDAAIVTDATLFKAGDELRFEHTDTLKWDAAAGSARLVTSSPSHGANRTYRIDEGTPRQEDVTISAAQPGDLKTASGLKFNHAAGAAIRDLSVEQEAAKIKSISGQTVQFTAPLKLPHVSGEALFVQGAANETATAFIERSAVEESNALRVVVRQDGHFRTASGKAPPQLAFTLRYYAYADQPFIRVRVRLVNHGVHGFGAGFTNQPPYTQHALLRSLSVLLPTTVPGSSSSEVLGAAEARARIAQKQSGASLAAGGVAGAFEIAVPEFVENYPKALVGNASGLRFDILPDLGGDHLFDGARAKTTDFYLGRNTIAARALTTAANASLDPAYVAGTGAVRPSMVEKRDWTKAFASDAQLGEAATLAERMLASAYAIEANQGAGAVPPMSMFEYRETGQQGEQFGWRNFGDLAWGDGYANVHYDLPFILLREYLRTGDARAFRLGSEMARYRADWGQHHANDYQNVERLWNFKGMAFYEKGDHGSFREPVPSHMWIEGLWLYWALTGDEAVRESAVDGSEAFYRMGFAGSLGWGESRWLGWPVLGLMSAYRYTGDAKYLGKAREGAMLFAETEENYGRQGYYLVRGLDGSTRIQPWGWSYSLLGAIEYWRETGDKRAADFLVRAADWLLGKNGKNPPLKPGATLADGSYLPGGAPYFWYADHAAEDRTVAYAGMTLPLLAAAARISGRADLWDRARLVFRDYAFYRDLTESKPVAPQSRQIINFRSVMYPGSAPKTYGQMGLTFAEYLPELMNSSRVPPPPPRDATPTPAGTPKPTPSAQPSPSVPPPQSGLVNVALNRPASASSYKTWPGCICTPAAANDGQINAGGQVSSWHSDVNTGRLEWWQVDLGQQFRIVSIELLFRSDLDQEQTRRNFEVRASNDPNFLTSARLAAQGEQLVAFGQTWSAGVADAGSYRYVRVRKTKLEANIYGEQYFNLAEARVLAQPFRAEPEVTPTPALNLSAAPRPLALNDLTARRALVGQTLDLTLARHDENGREMQIYARNLPAGASFDASTRRLRFSPDSSQAGNVYQIAFRAMNDRIDREARLDVAVVIDGAPDVKLLAPVAGLPIAAGNSVAISWSATGSARLTKYQLLLSIDGGASYPMRLAELPGSSNQYQWTIPRNFPISSQSMARVMIRGIDARGRAGLDFSRQDLRVSMNR